MRTKDPIRQCMPVGRWPAADRKSWQALLIAGSVLDDAGAGAHWRPLTRIGFAKSYGHWLNWLQLSEPALLDLPAEARMTPRMVESYITRFCTVVAPVTLASRIQTLWVVITHLAPDQDWSWLKRLAKRMQRRALPSRAKKDRIVSADEIYARGVKIMRDVDRQEQPDWRVAARFRDGLMLSLLISRPFRNRNFSSIEIGRHLLRSRGGYNIRFEASETKTHRELEAPVPMMLVPFLERYLTVYRSLLCQQSRRGGTSNRLWVSQIGTALTKESIYVRITSLTEQEFGVRINPHCFRDCAATSTATNAPEHVRIIRHILGHSTLQTSDRYYNHAKAVEALGRQQRLIASLRQRVKNSRQEGDHI